jgi:hypothetical protein
VVHPVGTNNPPSARNMVHGDLIHSRVSSSNQAKQSCGGLRGHLPWAYVGTGTHHETAIDDLSLDAWMMLRIRGKGGNAIHRNHLARFRRLPDMTKCSFIRQRASFIRSSCFLVAVISLLLQRTTGSLLVEEKPIPERCVYPPSIVTMTMRRG